jgi:hypothetical protein
MEKKTKLLTIIVLFTGVLLIAVTRLVVMVAYTAFP